MSKVALLIGVSEYEEGLSSLPSAVRDVQAFKRVLINPEISGFDEVRILLNPEPQNMQYEIETLFSGRSKDDLAMLYFSGHGLKDDNGRLYFATRITRKTQRGELIRSTAVPARFIEEVMNNSRAKRQVVILDCAFSGTFSGGTRAKDSGGVDIQGQLGGEGRVVLTSSSSIQYSFESIGSDLSLYTRYLVEGLESGGADRDSDGRISVDELHEYASQKVQETSPAMTPRIYAINEGFQIVLAKAPLADPRLFYRREIERYASQGDISLLGRRILAERQRQLGLTSEEASAIEVEVLSPYRGYQSKLEKYKQALFEATQSEYPLSESTLTDLSDFQLLLGLRDEDIAHLEHSIFEEAEQQLAERQRKLQKYEQVVLQEIEQQYPLPNESRDRLLRVQQSLGLEDKDVASIDERLGAQAAEKYQRKLRQYEQSFLEIIQQNNPTIAKDRKLLEELKQTLRLRNEDIADLEERLTSSNSEQQRRKLQEYEEALREAVNIEYPLNETILLELQSLRQTLGLSEEDIVVIEARVVEPIEVAYQAQIRQYEQAVLKALQHHYSLNNEDRENLLRLQERLKLGSNAISLIESQLMTEVETQYQARLEEYKNLLLNITQQEYPITDESHSKLRSQQNDLNLRKEDIAIIEVSIEAQITTSDIKEIRKVINEGTVRSYRWLAVAIIRRFGARDISAISAPSLQEDTTWEASLPKLGLKLRTQKVIFFLRQKQESLEFHERLADLVREKDAQFLIIADVSNIIDSPPQIGTQIIWFNSDFLMQVATTHKDELASWLGRFITTQIDLPTLLPYKTRGKTELFFGRDYELNRLVTGTMRGGILVGAHQSGKSSILEKLGGQLQMREYRVGILTVGAASNFQFFFERTLEVLGRELPEVLNLESWSSAIRNCKRTGVNPALLLDEVDGIIKLDAETGFRLGKEMRSLQADGFCEFYLAGHANLREAIEVEGGPLRNFAEELTLTGLAPEPAMRLIQEPMKQIGFTISDDFAGRIVKGTAGVAVLIQEFCLRLLRNFNQINISQIEEGEIIKVEESRDYLDFVFDYFKYAQDWCSMSIMLIIALQGEANKQFVMKEFRKYGVPIKLNTLDYKLKFLLRFGILIQSKSGFYKILPLYLIEAIRSNEPNLLLEAELENGKNVNPQELEQAKMEVRSDNLFLKIKNFFKK